MSVVLAVCATSASCVNRAQTTADILSVYCIVLKKWENSLEWEVLKCCFLCYETGFLFLSSWNESFWQPNLHNALTTLIPFPCTLNERTEDPRMINTCTCPGQGSPSSPRIRRQVQAKSQSVVFPGGDQAAGPVVEVEVNKIQIVGGISGLFARRKPRCAYLPCALLDKIPLSSETLSSCSLEVDTRSLQQGQIQDFVI